MVPRVNAPSYVEYWRVFLLSCLKKSEVLFVNLLLHPSSLTESNLRETYLYFQKCYSKQMIINERSVWLTSVTEHALASV